MAITDHQLDEAVTTGATTDATTDATTGATTDVTTPAPAELLRGWDHIEWWVGNARQAAQFFASAYGFDITAYAGPETGVADRVSYVLEQGAIRFVVTGSLQAGTPIATHVLLHGDGARDLALLVDDADLAYEAALQRGAVGLRAPWDEEDEFGTVRRATIATYGDTQHTFVQRGDYRGPFLPGYRTDNLPPRPSLDPVGLVKIDHVVGNVEQGSLDKWVGFYERTMGFDQLVHFGDDQISTEYSALMSTVVWAKGPSGTAEGQEREMVGKIVLPINEPADGRKKSQIEEYLDFYGCPGVQHVAMRTDDIVTTVRSLRSRGVRFLQVPPSYYDDAKQRLADVDLPWEALAELGILVDRDQDGHLLQIFTETMGDRPTVFFEIIQREGAKGFGAGNFKALFEAIEREQARRGNL